jgi:hypothetical protein
VSLDHGAKGSSPTVIVVGEGASVEADGTRDEPARGSSVPVILVDATGAIVHVGGGADRYVDALRADLAELQDELARPGRQAATRTARIDRGGVTRPV